MIGDVLQPTHLIFILVVALLVLGPKKLPEVGRSVGKGLREFRSAMSGDFLSDDSGSTTEAESVEAAPPVTPATTSMPSETAAEHTVTPMDVTNPAEPQPFSVDGQATIHERPADVVAPDEDRHGDTAADHVNPSEVDHVAPPAVDHVEPPAVDRVEPPAVDRVKPAAVDQVKPVTAEHVSAVEPAPEPSQPEPHPVAPASDPPSHNG